MAALVESGLTEPQLRRRRLASATSRCACRSGTRATTLGYADDPDKQLDWFLDTAERVKEQRVARGQSITDPNQFGEWIADVERPAEQYRGRYQLQLDEANRLLADTRHTGRRARAAADARCSTRRRRRWRGGAGPKALAALEEAEKYTGTPYRWGGSTPRDRLRLLGPRAVGVRAARASRSRA